MIKFSERVLAVALGGALLLPALDSTGALDEPMRPLLEGVEFLVAEHGSTGVPSDPRTVADRSLAIRTRELIRRSGGPGDSLPAIEELIPQVSLARDAAMRQGVPVSLVLAVIHSESRFEEAAVSPMGAIGLMQVQPATARAVAKQEGLPSPHRAELMDSRVNIEIGVALLKNLHEQYGSWERALAVYNAGPAAMASEDVRVAVGAYVRRVERQAQFLTVRPPAHTPAEA